MHKAKTDTFCALNLLLHSHIYTLPIRQNAQKRFILGSLFITNNVYPLLLACQQKWTTVSSTLLKLKMSAIPLFNVLENCHV